MEKKRSLHQPLKASVGRSPAYHLVDRLARVHRPGFEEQGAYFVLIPLSQWLIWSAVFYLFLLEKKRNPVTVTVE
jgi:hypothetical protein